MELSWQHLCIIVAMKTSKLAEEIYTRLEEKCFQGRVIAIRHLDALTKEIESLRNEGKFAEIVYKEYLPYFQVKVPESLPAVKSIIITSTMQPQQRVGFSLKGRQNHFIIPPTYSDETDHVVEGLLSDIIKPRGFNLYPAKVPLKLLAVHSGLARYGKNNIAYVEGMGSFHRLKAFFTDIPADEDSWFELEMLEECSNCTACIKKCPTKAIASNCFIIKAERCLTFHNERTVDFPEWINPSWHSCLVGCMDCQLNCPANRSLKEWIVESTDFNEEETDIVLKGNRSELTDAVKTKLQRLSFLEDFELLGRNLGVLIKQVSS